MIIFPAIDLYDRKVVRLYKGNYDEMTVYSDDPLNVAKDFLNCGATHIHIVDLEGAKNGETPNIDIVADIVKNTNLFVEIGGGIRSLDAVEKYLNVGVDRVIIGTAAVNDEPFLRKLISLYRDRIAVGADVKDGKIAVNGWLDISDITLDEFLLKMQIMGVNNVICTDISKDGAMKGTNIELYRRLSEKYSMNITASGGVSTIEDIITLKNMNLYGAIIGKAYYTGAISLSEAVEVSK